ncbi:Hypothetical protein MexAM1_META2p0264 (plasmid) [Methylorubrum extorquens AM1]|uniref:Uncharacterized protein n=1 Tax=Methylorubrum extorquens (strain ATCC 14718 / DSM 1338 / JCM 2805 / NCIMB 9133 / AM1) TaxID=272630 RepID=C5B3X6_METEA|nr:Hypothetical protein MexAM1_META2p0264 [Methylorubrum extorquens AM1]
MAVTEDSPVRGDLRVWADSSIVCVLLDEAAKARPTGTAADRARPLELILRARIMLLSAERLTV